MVGIDGWKGQYQYPLLQKTERWGTDPLPCIIGLRYIKLAGLFLSLIGCEVEMMRKRIEKQECCRSSYNSVFAVRFAHPNAYNTSQTPRLDTPAAKARKGHRRVVGSLSFLP